jgi:hypothetical protein
LNHDPIGWSLQVWLTRKDRCCIAGLNVRNGV